MTIDVHSRGAAAGFHGLLTAVGSEGVGPRCGSVGISRRFGSGVLEAHQDTYTEVLTDHFVRHLEALRDGM